MTNEEKQKLLKPGERLDDLQIGGLELIQNPEGFCFGVDAVFLSDFAKVRAGETALDGKAQCSLERAGGQSGNRDRRYPRSFSDIQAGLF